jgi:glycerate 2-kinase
MRILIAPQEFKGSLTAIEAAAAIAVGARRALPSAEVIEVPMSDGGPGLVDAMLAARGGERVETDVHDPLMRPIPAAWAILDEHAAAHRERTAAIEMAAASGLVLLRPDERDPLVATTYGTGELILAALDLGCAWIIVGVGGSATLDGGAGAMQALGARLLDASGGDLPPGGGPLERLDRIDLTGRDARLARVAIRVACDVTNTLCGPAGAAVMFGPQKGASPADVPVLDAALRRFADIVRRDCGIDLLALSGGGAAGGLAAGLAAVAGATVEPGFGIVAEAAGLEAKIAAADLVITGEGRLDVQTAYGKTASGVAALARRHGKRVAVIAGSVDPGYDADAGAFDLVESVLQPGMTVEDAMRNAASLLAAAAERVVRKP